MKKGVFKDRAVRLFGLVSTDANGLHLLLFPIRNSVACHYLPKLLLCLRHNLNPLPGSHHIMCKNITL